MKKQFVSAINPSPLMSLSRTDVARMIRDHRAGRAVGVLCKTESGYTLNARLVWAIA